MHHGQVWRFNRIEHLLLRGRSKANRSGRCKNDEGEEDNFFHAGNTAMRRVKLLAKKTTPDSRVAAPALEATLATAFTTRGQNGAWRCKLSQQLTCSRRTPNVASRFRWPGGGLGPPNHATTEDRRYSVTRLKEAFLFY